MTTSTRGGSEALTRPDGTPIKILTVDDEASLTELLSMAMRYEGWEVATAGSGIAAVKAAREVRPDAIVLDMMLPDFDGLEVMRRIRAEQPDVPVIFLTAKDAVDDRVQGLTAGGDDYVTKPFSLEELVARLRALQGGKQSGGITSLLALAQQLLRVVDLVESAAGNASVNARNAFVKIRSGQWLLPLQRRQVSGCWRGGWLCRQHWKTLLMH